MKKKRGLALFLSMILTLHSAAVGLADVNMTAADSGPKTEKATDSDADEENPDAELPEEEQENEPEKEETEPEEEGAEPEKEETEPEEENGSDEENLENEEEEEIEELEEEASPSDALELPEGVEVPEDAYYWEENGHYYKFVDERQMKSYSWYEAERACEEMGGHLVTLESREEHMFVRRLQPYRSIWLGLTKEDGGDWEWITGEPFIYEDWLEGNLLYSEDQHYACILAYEGTWQPFYAANFAGYVCEWDEYAGRQYVDPEPERPENVPEDAVYFDLTEHWYQYVVDDLTWRDAVETCEKAQGYLITITSGDENALAMCLRPSSCYTWIGASDEETEGIWKWVTGEPFDYTDWRGGEPNNAHGNEDYACIPDLGHWNDGGENLVAAAGNGYICEWDESLPEEREETLIERVKKYTSEFDQEYIDEIINGPGTEIEKYNKLNQYYNELKEGEDEAKAFSSLTNNNLYASYLFSKNYSDVGRAALGLNGLIYGELWDHITLQDVEYNKYKEMLSSFMRDNQENEESEEYVSLVTDILKDQLEEAQGAKEKELQDALDLIESRNVDKKECQKILDSLKEQYTMDIDNLKYFSEICEHIGQAAGIIMFAGNEIEKVIELEATFQCQENYLDFLQFIEENENLPSKLQKAAHDLGQTLFEQTVQTMNRIIKEAKSFMLENFIEIEDLIKGETLGKVFGSISLGIEIVDLGLNMSEFVDAATYVEGYGLLQEEYTEKLLKDKERFLEAPTEENAKQFKRDYELLWALRSSGEDKFKEFVGYDDTWPGHIRQLITFWIDYEQYKQIVDISKQYLKESKFTMTDTVYEKKSMLKPFDMEIQIACKADVYVRNSSGNVVIQAENGKISEFDENTWISMIADGDITMLRMPFTSDYEIEIKAAENGVMRYSALKKPDDDEEGFLSTVRDIEVRTGDTYYAVPASQFKTLIDAEGMASEFKEEMLQPDEPEDHVYITATAGPGGTALGTGNYYKGQYVMLSAVPKEGYSFSGWMENGVLLSSDSILGFKAETDRALQAEFIKKNTEQEAFTITTRASQGGKIQPGGTITVKKGENQTFWFIPDPGYKVGEIIIDGISLGVVEKYNFEEVTADHSVEAYFEKLDHPSTDPPVPPEEPDKPSENPDDSSGSDHSGGDSGGSSGGNSGGSGSHHSGGSSGGGGGSSSGGNGGFASSSGSAGGTGPAGDTGIITGPNQSSGDGLCHWMLDSIGWRLQYPDGSYAKGTSVVDRLGCVQETYLWLLINGAWYAFGADGYAESGLFRDAGYGGSWFYVDINSGMKTGWQLVDGIWRYFNPVSDGRQGSMFTASRTPDGYYVNENGEWDGGPANP